MTPLMDTASAISGATDKVYDKGKDGKRGKGGTGGEGGKGRKDSDK